MKELEFLIDVSPQWWIKARNNEKFLKQYVFEKFERDYYPRIVQQGRRKIINSRLLIKVAVNIV